MRQQLYGVWFTTELLDRHFIGGFTWTPIAGFGSGWWGRTTFTWVKATYTNRCANPLYPNGQFQVMPSTILKRRATTWTLAASCNGLVWMVRLELTASASQMRRSANWTTSRFDGWIIYPLTSHSSWRTLPLAVSRRPRQVLPPDIMYCIIASPPCQYLFENFLKYFLHTTYQKMQADLIRKFYLSNYTRFNLSLQIAIKIMISYLDLRTALSRAAASARCSGVRSRLIGGLGGLNHEAGQCTRSPSSSL